MPDRPRVGLLATGDRWHVQALAAALERLGCEAVLCPATRMTGRIEAGAAVRAGGVRLRAPDAPPLPLLPPRSPHPILVPHPAPRVAPHARGPGVQPPPAL